MAPREKPVYEKLPVIEKLDIRNTTVSKPSLKIAKNTTKNTPHAEISIALTVWSSSAFLSLTFFDNQNTTYQIKNAVKYKKIDSNSALTESLPKESFAFITRYATKILAKIDVKMPYQSLTKCEFWLVFPVKDRLFQPQERLLIPP